MSSIYAPGCALMLYKPHLADQILSHLVAEGLAEGRHLTCCRHEPGLDSGTVVINTCPGCDRRYRELHEGVTTVSLWEVLGESETFPFPDYGGAEMAIHDACPTRDQPRIHDVIRGLLGRMNVTVVEPSGTRDRAVCCGDSFFGELGDDEVKKQMRRRAEAMPREDVVVYCVSCVKAMEVGGKRPRHLVDLLFGEATAPGVVEPEEWHAELERFIAEH